MVQKTKTAISILQQRGEENAGGQSHEGNNAAAGEQIRLPGVYDSGENMQYQKVKFGNNCFFFNKFTLLF